MTFVLIMKNQEVADILYKIADILEINGELIFKVAAYRRAGQSIESLSKDIGEIYKNRGLEGLREISGIGKDISLKAEEIIKTGKLNYLDEIKKKTPIDVESLINIDGLGPKRISILYKKLRIKNKKDLEKAAKENKIRNIPGFGAKAEENILKSIKFSKISKQRFVLGYVWPDILKLENKLKESKDIEKVEICGSARRRKETIGDLDILVISRKPENVMNYFTGLDVVKRIIAKGSTKSTVILDNNMQVDLRVLPRESFGAAMQYFIGNKEHNIELRKIAISKGYKLSEYGLFKKKKIIAADDERKIYTALGLNYIEPEMRENTGEIGLSKRHRLPKLVELKDIKGDTHMHTNQTDGVNTMKEMIEKAVSLGREYIVISDHTKSLGIANGLNERQLLKQIEFIEKINKKYPGIKILSGCEANIMGNGNPDINNSVLKRLDVVTASIHSGLKQDEEKITKRIAAAMENENVDIIGHPTGRIIQKRDAYAVNMNKMFEKAKETGTCLEIDSFPTRLDLKDVYIKEAVNRKIKLVISSDAHHTSHQEFMQFGVWQARRGWAEAKDIINTFPLEKFLKTKK